MTNAYATPAPHPAPSQPTIPSPQHWKDRAEASDILAVIMLLLIGLPSWAPRLFERRRCLIVGAARLALWVQPWIVNPRGMQAVFLAHPSQGVRGLLFDLWQLLLGTRTLAMFVTAIIAPLPTLPHLALALFAFEVREGIRTEMWRQFHAQQPSAAVWLLQESAAAPRLSSAQSVPHLSSPMYAALPHCVLHLHGLPAVEAPHLAAPHRLDASCDR